MQRVRRFTFFYDKQPSVTDPENMLFAYEGIGPVYKRCGIWLMPHWRVRLAAWLVDKLIPKCCVDFEDGINKTVCYEI